MHGDEAEIAEAKRIIELEERLERGNAHCFVVMDQPAEGTPEEPTVSVAKRKASVARDRPVAREAWLLDTKTAPLTSCLAEDWEEDYAKSEYWAALASSKSGWKLLWLAGLRFDDWKLFFLTRC